MLKNIKSKQFKDKNIKTFSSFKRLKDKKYVKEALFDCLLHDDLESFKEILRAHFEIVNKNQIIKKTGISKRTLYRSLSQTGNPIFKNISKLLQAI